MRLKGGYDVDIISECSLAVTKVLLGEPAPMLPSMVASEEATETVYQVALVQSKYWKSIKPHTLAPSEGAPIIPDSLLASHHLPPVEEQEDVVTIPGQPSISHIVGIY